MFEEKRTMISRTALQRVGIIIWELSRDFIGIR